MTCGCGGAPSTRYDTIRSLFGRPVYLYNVEVQDLRGSGQGNATFPSPPFEYFVCRRDRRAWGVEPHGVRDYLRVCGCWGPRDLASGERVVLAFGSGTEADAYVKRLRYGIPHRWPIWVALAAGVIGIAQIVAEIIC